MSEESPRFRLPLIAPGQVQKELFHNEALLRIDAALQAAVEGEPLVLPPAAPVEGQCWIVGIGASGAWAGHDSSLALWSEGGWRFVSPTPGMTVWNTSAAVPMQWREGAWSTGDILCTQVVIGGHRIIGERRPAVTSPSGGTIIDAEARTAIADLIATLKSHGLTD